MTPSGSHTLASSLKEGAKEQLASLTEGVVGISYEFKIVGRKYRL